MEARDEVMKNEPKSLNSVKKPGVRCFFAMPNPNLGYGLASDKNEIKSEVENTSISYFSNFFFNLFSLDQSPILCPLLLKNSDRATYGTSFKCGNNIRFWHESLK